MPPEDAPAPAVEAAADGTALAALQAAVAAAFAAAGPVAAAIPGFHTRPGQTRMAHAVAETLFAGGPLVVEAATGVGKTFAYLIPALLAGERVLVSTATKALQEQLFHRDLPRLIAALGLPVRTALLKGRSSYLCLRRMELAAHSAELATPELQQQLARVERWSKVTRSGDLSELPWLSEQSALLPLITSTHENCLGAECPFYRACHVNLARRQAMAADVVVINHHLFFADLAIRESGVAELLPTVRCVIFDEAHKLNETGIQFLGQQLGSAQVINLARDLLTAGLEQAAGLFDWRRIAADLELAARKLRLAAGHRGGAGRLRWLEAAPEGVAATPWLEALQGLEATLAQAATELAGADELGPDLARVRERLQDLAALARRFLAPGDPEAVRWVEVRGGVRLVESPLDIAHTVQTRLLASAAPGPQPDRPRAWVFVSATLGADEQLRWFTEPCGLQDATLLRIASPFHYAEQGVCYIPGDFPAPSAPGHSACVAELVGTAAAILGGRTLVLTTTLRALREIGDALERRFADRPDLAVLVQGRQSKRVLVERFRQAAGGSILVGSASFWEGFDVPGEALQLVVIDKLPFPPPDDPMVEARCRRLQAQGKSPFRDYSLPAAAVALRQGAGRLIRSESDQGALVVCDNRLLHKGYGRRLLQALPPMRRVASEAELLDFLRALLPETGDLPG